MRSGYTLRQRPQRDPSGKPMLDAAGQPRREPHWTIVLRLAAGRRRTLKTKFTSRRAAEALAEKLTVDAYRSHLSDVLDKLQRRHTSTISDLLRDYREAGCPDRRMLPRTGDSLARELRHLLTAERFWGARNPRTVTAADRYRYRDWRVAHVKKGTGLRSAELELVSLSSVFHWSVATERLPVNPLAGAVTFRDPQTIRHCRDTKPRSGDDLHRLAHYFFQDPRSEVLGWQLLVEGLTGLRTSECLSLRIDAVRRGDVCDPGYMDERFLHVRRCKLRGGCVAVTPYIQLDDPLRPCIRPLLLSLRAWVTSRYPDSVWYLPGRDGISPLSTGSLSKALVKACPMLGLPKITSHGLRAYYCTARRSQGIDDIRLAYEMGHRSGPDQVRRTYGDPPAHWVGLANVFTWLPITDTIPAAWTHWE